MMRVRNAEEPFDDEYNDEDYDEWVDEDDDFDDGGVVGPDERDRDLLDGTWEQRYYSGQERSRDWGTIAIAISLVVLASLILPSLLVILR